jgi:hypothetical protein
MKTCPRHSHHCQNQRFLFEIAFRIIENSFLVNNLKLLRIWGLLPSTMDVVKGNEHT